MRTQVRSYLFDLSSERDRFQTGDNSAPAGDLDGDGTPDIVAAQLPRSPGQPTEVRACSGEDGRTLWTVLHGVAGDLFGSALDAGRDIDGDGVGDVIAGFGNGAPATGASYVLVLSGVDGTTVRRIDVLEPSRTPSAFGFQVCGLRDTDADGRDEVVVSDPYWSSPGAGSATQTGKVWVVSGGTGRVLWAMTGPPFDYANLGFALNRAGDVNADGREDLIVSVPSLRAFSPSTVLVIAGRTYQILHVLTKPAGVGFGLHANGAGDLDRDGRDDVVCTDQFGLLDAYSGRDGTLLWSAPGPLQSLSGSDLIAGVGDADGDGWPDVAHVDLLRSGRDGGLIARFTPGAGRAVTPVAGVGDVNGDGLADVLGGAFVYSAVELPLFSPTHTVSASAGGTQDLVVQARGHDGKMYLVLGSFSGTRPGLVFGHHTLPLNLDWWLTFTLQTQNSPLLTASLGVVGSAPPARAQLAVPAGVMPCLAGLTMWHAYVVIDSATWSLDLISNAVPLALVL